MKDYIRYKAGPLIIQRVREEGVKPQNIRVFAAPAGGPKWFVSVGFDRALMKTRFLQRGGGRVLLAGSSAGAWRCLAMACHDPLNAYERLRIAYSRNIFTAQDTPATVSDALKRNVDQFIGDRDIDAILGHPTYDVALHTVRSRGPAGSDARSLQAVALLVGAGLNIFSARGLDFLYERVVFYSGEEMPAFLGQGFRGRAVPLSEENVRKAALATGSLPYIIQGVKDIDGAPRGTYRDGGLTDYQLNQDYAPGPDGIALFFHYQERITPGWLDKKLTWRNPPKESLARLLQVYPGPDFLKSLPDQRLPDRQDFIQFVDDPAERIRRWDQVSEISSILGDRFMEDVESGRIRNLVQPIDIK